MGAGHGKPRPTVRSAVDVIDQSDEEIDVIDLEYSDYFDDVFEDSESVQNGSSRKLRLWDFPYSSPTKKRSASENGAIAFTRRGLYSESDAISPPKPDYGTILNHGRKRIQSAKEVRSNSKRSSLLKKLFTKPIKKSDPDSDVYQANSFRRLHIPSSDAMGTCCSAATNNPSGFSQSDNFSRTFPHKREGSSYKRGFEGETHGHKRTQNNAFTENDKNRSNIVRLSESKDACISNGRSSDIRGGRVSPNQKRDMRDLIINKHLPSGGYDRQCKPKPFPRTVVNVDSEKNVPSIDLRKTYMQQPNISRHRKLTPAVPLTIPVFKAPMLSSLPPVGDVEDFEREGSFIRSSHSTPTKVKSRPPPINYHNISPPFSSSWPSLSNGDEYHPHIPPSTPPHRRLLSPSPKHLKAAARQNVDMLPKRKLVRKLTPIILEVPKNLEGRSHSLSDGEDEADEFLQNGVYGYESMVEGTPKSNGYGLSDEYREELKNTVDELIDQLSPTIVGDEFIDRPYGRSPSYWRRQPSPARNFVFPDVRQVDDNCKLETTFSSSVNGYSRELSPSMTPINNKVHHQRKITPAPSAQPPLYRLDPDKMAFNSSAFAEDEGQL